MSWLDMRPQAGSLRVQKLSELRKKLDGTGNDDFGILNPPVRSPSASGTLQALVLYAQVLPVVYLLIQAFVEKTSMFHC